MLLDGFQGLTRCGFDLASYSYVGFGSIFFYDYVFFYKYLGFRRLVSIEHATDITNRVLFNKPFDNVEVEIGDAATYLSSFSQDELAVAWLDFDDWASDELLSAVEIAAHRLAPGSIVLCTLDAEIPKGSATPRSIREFFSARCQSYFAYEWKNKDFKASLVALRTRDLIVAAFDRGLATRVGVFLEPLFSFTYADGHLMYTFGGMLAREQESRSLRSLPRVAPDYWRRTAKQSPFDIRVPVLTRRERLLLDQRLPGSPSVTELEINEEDLRDYAEVFRYMPTYGELLA
jgi:hypothetical protein